MTHELSHRSADSRQGISRQNPRQHLTRRGFLRSSAATAAGLLILESSKSAWSYQANQKLNIALVGVGGRGSWFVSTIPGLGENLVALCDVNDTMNPSAYEKLPKARRYHDFRKLLEEMHREIDALIVAAPDHIHAPASVMAMKLGKHVYCEKPLTHSVHEARRMRAIARQQKVATQKGNQGTASLPFRQSFEIIQRGLLGEVREVYAWNDAGGPGRRPRPQGTPSVPEHLQWDLWLGPAAERPYHPAWLNWHGWRDFGTGNLGNWASHTLNLPFMALRVDSLWKTQTGAPATRLKLEAEVSEVDSDSLPKWEIVRYDVPARSDLPPVRITWFNGAGSPGQRQKVEDLMGRRLDWGDAGEKKWTDHGGCLIVGSKGLIHTTAHNATLTLLPAGQFKDFRPPPPSLGQSPGHEREWLAACKGGPPAASNFDYSGPLAEFVLLGNVATLFPGPLEYDPALARVVGHEKANAALRRDYRPGWTL
jgi:hypothetical protein